MKKYFIGTMVISLFWAGCFSSMLWAKTCQSLGHIVYAKYNYNNKNYDVPIMSSWSKASGNIVELEIKSKTLFSELKVFYVAPEEDKTLIEKIKIHKNKILNFDLERRISTRKRAFDQLDLYFLIDSKKEGCHQYIDLIDADGGGVVEVNRAKK